MANLIYKNTTFLLSAPNVQDLPKDVGSEVAFIGASNVGKSSAINKIAGSKKLARVGKTPGVTQFINVFKLDDNHRLIDLPGYGFARVSKAIRENWHELVNTYLLTRESLKGLFLLIDCRHPLKEGDEELLEWCSQVNLPICVLLTKADKLKRSELNSVLQKAKHECGRYAKCEVRFFSSVTGIGVEEVFKQLTEWLD